MTVTNITQTQSPLTVARLVELPGLQKLADDPNDQAMLNEKAITEAKSLLAAATELCRVYLRGGECPSSVMDEAVIRTAGHIHTRLSFGAIEGTLTVGGNTTMNISKQAVSPVRKSGAGAMLSPYVRRTA